MRLESAACPGLIGGWSTFAGAIERASVDAEKLTTLAEQLSTGVTLRRVGSLAEAQGLAALAESLPKQASDTRIVPLDPQAPAVRP